MTTIIGRSRTRGVETLSLDATGTRNALSARLVAALAEALAECGKDPEVRAVVLTHTGNTFSAGADLREPPHPDALVALLRQLVELPKPVLAGSPGMSVRAASACSPPATWPSPAPRPPSPSPRCASGWPPR